MKKMLDSDDYAVAYLELVEVFSLTLIRVNFLFAFAFFIL